MKNLQIIYYLAYGKYFFFLNLITFFISIFLNLFIKKGILSVLGTFVHPFFFVFHITEILIKFLFISKLFKNY